MREPLDGSRNDGGMVTGRSSTVFGWPVIVAVSVLAGLGWMFAALTGIDGLTAYLATTPGGIDPVAVVALGSGADAPLVLAVQTLRLLAGALLGRWWA